MAKENRYIDYVNIERMHYIPTEDKDIEWMKDMLKIMSLNAVDYVDRGKMKKCREFEKGMRDIDEAKKIIDPPTDKSEGGTPKNFASNFHQNYIHTNINRIVDAKMQYSTKNIRIKCIDGYALSKKMKENRKIIEREKMVKIINEYNRQIGYPLLNKTDDPYKYIQKEKKRLEENDRKIMDGKPIKQKELSSNPVSIIDYIKEKVNDSEGTALYNEYVYKDDIAVPCELGIKYYSEQNNLKIIESRIHKDLRHASALALRFYTSEINGEPVLQYVYPENLKVNRMSDSDYDCKGLEFVYYDMNITFGEFMKTIGAKLSPEQLQVAFNHARQAGGLQPLLFSNATRLQVEDQNITIRYAELLTQNIDVYSEANINGNYTLKPAKFDFKNRKGNGFKRVEKNYNVWYYCYSIPLTSSTNEVGTSTEFFMIDGGMLQDQQRHGYNERFSKSSFILHRRNDMVSFTEIEMDYMGELNPLWDKIKNDIRQSFPHGVIFNWNAVEAMMEVMEETGSPSEGFRALVKQIRQTGSGVLPEFGEEGKRTYSWLTKDMSTGHIKSALDKLTAFNMIYQQMKIALGINDATEGIEPKARQSLGGVELASQASNNSRFYMVDSKSNMLEELGYRFVGYFSEIVNEGGDRFKRFADVVGYANELEMQTIKDIPLHKIGLYVDHTDDSEVTAMVNGIVMELAKTGRMSMSTALFIISVENVNYKYALVRLEEKEFARKQEEARISEQQFKIQEMNKKAELEKYISDMKKSEYAHKKQVDLRFEVMSGRYKTQNQVAIKKQITEGRKTEKTHEKKLENNREQAIAEADAMGTEPSNEIIGADDSVQQQESITNEQV